MQGGLQTKKAPFASTLKREHSIDASAEGCTAIELVPGEGFQFGGLCRRQPVPARKITQQCIRGIPFADNVRPQRKVESIIPLQAVDMMGRIPRKAPTVEMVIVTVVGPAPVKGTPGVKGGSRAVVRQGQRMIVFGIAVERADIEGLLADRRKTAGKHDTCKKAGDKAAAVHFPHTDQMALTAMTTAGLETWHRRARFCPIVYNKCVF